MQRLLADPGVRVEVVSPGPAWPDPSRRAAAVHPVTWLSDPHLAGDPGYLALWQRAAAAVRAALTDMLDPAVITGPALATALLAALPAGALLVLGSSAPVRDLDAAATPRADLTVLANRGLAGIDGTVSTALGAALAHQSSTGSPVGSAAPTAAGAAPGYALLGDLTFLHDSNGLLIGPDEPRPDLTLVVANDDGGGIFTTLEQGGPDYAEDFERLFGTPTRADLAALCAATGTPYRRLDELATLPDELGAPAGLRVLEVRLDRAGRPAHARAMREAASAALAAVLADA